MNVRYFKIRYYKVAIFKKESYLVAIFRMLDMKGSLFVLFDMMCSLCNIGAIFRMLHKWWLFLRYGAKFDVC